ncbi:MAG: DUF3106 domain-containing protein, partial [Nitrospira sp.]|nr:DUF3106 domain-containing protein [Nitrospira sp.]
MGHFIKRLLHITILLAMVGLPGLSTADEPAQLSPDTLERLETWKNLSPERQEALRRALERWKSLPPDRQAEIRMR